MKCTKLAAGVWRRREASGMTKYLPEAHRHASLGTVNTSTYASCPTTIDHTRPSLLHATQRHGLQAGKGYDFSHRSLGAKQLSRGFRVSACPELLCEKTAHDCSRLSAT